MDARLLHVVDFAFKGIKKRLMLLWMIILLIFDFKHHSKGISRVNIHYKTVRIYLYRYLHNIIITKMYWTWQNIWSYSSGWCNLIPWVLVNKANLHAYKPWCEVFIVFIIILFWQFVRKHIFARHVNLNSFRCCCWHC